MAAMSFIDTCTTAESERAKQRAAAIEAQLGALSPTTGARSAAASNIAAEQMAAAAHAGLTPRTAAAVSEMLQRDLQTALDDAASQLNETELGAPSAGRAAASH